MEKTSFSSRERKKASVVGVIPARYASTRFPGKVISLIEGKPLVQHVWENACLSSKLDQVLVAVDNERVRETVSKFGASTVMTSPDLCSGSDRVAEVVKKLDCEIVVNLQADEPLLRAQDIDKLIQVLIDNPHFDLATLVFWENNARLLQDPHIVKCVSSLENRALYFSRQPLISHADGRFLKHIGIYAFRRKTLLQLASLPQSPLELTEKLEQLRALENGFQIGVVPIEQDLVSVDVPTDIAKVESILSQRAKVIS